MTPARRIGLGVVLTLGLVGHGLSGVAFGWSAGDRARINACAVEARTQGTFTLKIVSETAGDGLVYYDGTAAALAQFTACLHRNGLADTTDSVAPAGGTAPSFEALLDAALERTTYVRTVAACVAALPPFLPRNGSFPEPLRAFVWPGSTRIRYSDPYHPHLFDFERCMAERGYDVRESYPGGIPLGDLPALPDR
jgi:hypothetical protein